MKGSVAIEYEGAAVGTDAISFSVAAAHELKAPLALIRQLSLGLEQGIYEYDDELRILRQIILTAEKGLRMTSDLTRTARLDDSLFALETINARQLCEEVAHEIAPLYAAHGRNIQLVAGKRQVLAVGNRDLLRRILMNFSDNALQYANGTIPAPVLIRVSSFMDGSKVRLGVRDYGPAVPSDAWRRIKRYLGTAPQILQNRPASSGLGLYLSGQFAEAMNGSIGATRHHDGATFYVDLLASQQLKLL